MSVLTTFLPSPAPPIKAATAEQEYHDDYHNNERRCVHGLPLLSFRCMRYAPSRTHYSITENR